MNIFRVVKKERYVTVDKGFVENPNLSWKAKGILLYLLSKPDDWQVYENDLVSHASDGRDGVRSGIRELEAAGYILRTQKRDDSGRMSGYEYEVYESPTVDGKTVDGKTGAGKPAATNILKELNNNKTKSTPASPLSSEKLFEELWILYPRRMGKGQVSAAKKKEIYNQGRDQMIRCIDRFKDDMQKQQRPEDKIPYGSTFFNSGYIDYLDDNYNVKSVKKPFKITV